MPEIVTNFEIGVIAAPLTEIDTPIDGSIVEVDVVKIFEITRYFFPTCKSPNALDSFPTPTPPLKVPTKFIFPKTAREVPAAP